MTSSVGAVPTSPDSHAIRGGLAATPALWRSLPFASATILALVALLLAGTITHPVLVAMGLILAAVVTIATLIAGANRLPAWATVAAAVFFMIAIGLIRVGAGGPASGFAPLLLVPALWLALVGGAFRAIIGIATMAIVLVVPMIIGGSPDEFDAWRRVALLVLAAAFSVAMIRRLVEDGQRSAAEIERQARGLSEQVALTKAVVERADDMILSVDVNGRVFAANHAVLTDLGLAEDHLVGRDMFDAIVPATDHARLRAAFTAAATGDARDDGESLVETEFRHIDGRLVPVEISVAVTQGQLGLATHVFARDISARREADKLATEHLDDLARLLQIARDLGRPSSTGDGRHAVCEAARELTGADLAIFFEAQPELGVLVGTGVAGEGHVPARITLDDRTSLTARVFETLIPEFVGDMDVDERIDRATAVRMNIRSGFFQPVTLDGRAIGVLNVYWRRPLAEISERSRSLLELFAMQAAGVVERADLTTRLEHLARTDALTGLANRRALEESLVRELARAERAGTPLSVVMLDIDEFKKYNDDLGHQAGDALLRAIATGWARELRVFDVLARYGGEEFTVVLPAAPLTRATEVANRLREAMPSGTTVSAGVATWDSHEAMAELIARADAALYEAKRLGRNRTETASEAAHTFDGPTLDAARTKRRRTA